MTTLTKLSKMEAVSIRDCWANEAQDFTPWLAEDENIAQLADAIGIDELLVKAQEEHVGPFRADILCEEPDSHRLVLIENQLEKTDHTHLGQIFTYAAGLDAVIIVWIAEQFTEEHRAAIDWLNRITDSEFNFFGVEIKLYRIGDSLPAPMFDVVAKPNGWSKEALSASKVTRPDNLTDVKAMQLEFWEAFRDYMKQNPSKTFRPQAAQPHCWMVISLGISHVRLSLIVNSQKNKITLRIEFYDDLSKTYFDRVEVEKDKIEAAIGSALEWQRNEGKKTSVIGLSREGDFSDKTRWDDYFNWFRTYSEKFINTFKPIVKKL